MVTQIRSMASWAFRFQSRVIPSVLPLARVRPSGLNAIASTVLPLVVVRGWPSGWGCAGSATFHSRDRAVAVAAGQGAAIGAERHRVDDVAAAADGQGLAERPGVRGVGDVPQPDRAVGVAAGQGVAIGAERHRDDARRCRWSGAGRAAGGARGRRRSTAGPCRRCRRRRPGCGHRG